MTVGEQLRASASPSALTLRAGQSARVTVTVDHTGTIVDQFQLRVVGLDATWYELTAAQVSLFPRETGTLGVLVHVPNTTAIEARLYRAQLVVASMHDPSRQAIVPLTIEVPLERQLELELRPERVTTRGRARYVAHLQNLGNAEQVVDLLFQDPELALEAELEQQRVALAPGAAALVELRVQPRRWRFIGVPRYHPFCLALLDPAEPTAEPLGGVGGMLVHRPPFAFAAGVMRLLQGCFSLFLVLTIASAVLIWLLGSPGQRVESDEPAVAANAGGSATPEPEVVDDLPPELAGAAPAGTGAGALAQAAGAPAAAAGGGPVGRPAAPAGGPVPQPGVSTGANGPAALPVAAAKPSPAPLGPLPVIVNFEVRSPPDAAPGVLQLIWEVQNTDEVTIGGVALPASGNVFLQGLQQGEIELVARNRAGVTRRSVGVLVLRAPEILAFDGTTELAQAGQPATLTWQIVRAERARLFGPDLDPLGQIVEPAQGTLQVTPQRDAVYTLVAENALGRVQEELPIRVIVPAATFQPTVLPTGT